MNKQNNTNYGYQQTQIHIKVVYYCFLSKYVKIILKLILHLSLKIANKYYFFLKTQQKNFIHNDEKQMRFAAML